MIKRFLGVCVVAAVLFAVGCDSGGGGSSPKAETGGVQFKEKSAPQSPAGGSPKQPGPAAKAE